MKKLFAAALCVVIAALTALPCFASCSVTYVVEDDEKGIRADMVSNLNPTVVTEEYTLKAAVCGDAAYAFAGWYTEPEYVNELKTVEPTGSLTLFAKWEKQSFSIEYDLGGVNAFYAGCTNPNRRWYDPGEGLKLEPLTFDNDGFSFGGWFFDSKFSEPAESVTPDMAENLTLYALITQKIYQINYVLAPEGSGVDGSKATHTNKNFRSAAEAVQLEDAVILDTALVFGGWYSDRNYENRVYEIESYTLGAVTLYAKWDKRVTYVPEWGDATVSGGLTAADARAALRYSAKLQTLDALGVRLSDLNGDGEVTAADARLILRLSAKLETIENLTEKYSLPDVSEVIAESETEGKK